MSDTGTEIVRAPLQTQMQWAEAVAQAGDLIPKAFRDRARVLVAIQYGAMLDVNPIVAMNEIHVIEGTPTMSAHLMAGVVRRAGHKVRIRSTGTWEAGDFAATVTIIRSDDPEPFVATWTKERAQRAGLLGKNNWKNYPEAMCKARATTECARDAASEALMGIKYSPEELDAVVNEQGDPIDLTATAIDRTPPRGQQQPAPEPRVDERTGEVRDEPATRPPYDQAEADEWAAQIDGVPELGHPEAKGAIESDTLAGVLLRAEKAGVLDHWLDDPERVAGAMTVEGHIHQRREQLQAQKRRVAGA